MIRYFDTGQNGPNDCLGVWLDQELVAGVRSFRGQFGFFDGTALRPFMHILQGMIAAGGVLRLVIGSNAGNPLTTDELTLLLPLLGAADRTSLTVVESLAGSLFHPKTMHLMRNDGSRLGVVSSANFTQKGLGHSVEAGVILEAAAGTEAAVQQIATAIDRWATSIEPGVYQLRTTDDVEALRRLGLAVTQQARRAIRARQRTGAGGIGRGTRPVGWRSPAAPAEIPRDETEEIEEGIEPHQPAAIDVRWAKLLKRSDAQQVPAGTNPTGKLRLSQAHFPIDQATWFREVLFGDQQWVQSQRRGTTYEELHVLFRVSRHGDPWVPMTLKVDHGAHRVANQNNVPTVLSWGPELGVWLRDNNQVGHWVAMERDVNGDFWLSVQAVKPAWAP